MAFRVIRPDELEWTTRPHEPDEAPRIYDVRPLPFERAVERALREWESLEPLGAR